MDVPQQSLIHLRLFSFDHCLTATEGVLTDVENQWGGKKPQHSGAIPWCTYSLAIKITANIPGLEESHHLSTFIFVLLKLWCRRLLWELDTAEMAVILLNVVLQPIGMPLSPRKTLPRFLLIQSLNLFNTFLWFWCYPILFLEELTYSRGSGDHSGSYGWSCGIRKVFVAASNVSVRFQLRQRALHKHKAFFISSSTFELWLFHLWIWAFIPSL